MDKKAWNTGEAFFGEIKGGMVKDYPIKLCREILAPEGATLVDVNTGGEGGDIHYLLNKLGEKFEFEMNVGFNGKIWIKGRMSDTVFIFNCLDRLV